MRARVVSREKGTTLLFLSSRFAHTRLWDTSLPLKDVRSTPRFLAREPFPAGPSLEPSSVRFVIRDTNPRGYLDSLLECRQSVRVTRTVKRAPFSPSFCYLARLFLKYRGFKVAMLRRDTASPRACFPIPSLSPDIAPPADSRIIVTIDSGRYIKHLMPSGDSRCGTVD